MTSGEIVTLNFRYLTDTQVMHLWRLIFLCLFMIPIGPLPSLASVESEDFKPFSKNFESHEDVVDQLRAQPQKNCSPDFNASFFEVIERSESLNQTTNYQTNETLLHLAVTKECSPIIEWLLEHGADWKIRNTQGLNALDIALKNGSTEVLNLFLSYLSQSPIRGAQSKAFVTWMNEQPGERKTQSEIKVKLGFSIANVSKSQILVLNAALKGMYRLDEHTSIHGKTDFFFNKVNDDIRSIRYLIDTRLVRENLLKTPWNGSIDIKGEGYLKLNTLELASLIERSWELYDKTLTLEGGLGPGIRLVYENLDNSNNETATDTILRAKEAIHWSPDKDFLFLKAGKYSIDQSLTYSTGASGDSSLFETSMKHKLNNHLSLGAVYKHWRASLLETNISDNQILLELTYEAIN